MDKSATLIDSNGVKYCFDKISNVKITSTVESFINKNMTVSFDVLTNDNKEYFKMILPDKGEKELNGTVIYCRFETAKGSFNENTNDMLMMMMLSGNNPFEQKHECKCGCNIGDYVATPNTSIDPCFGADFDWTKFAPRDEININVNAMDIETDK